MIYAGQGSLAKMIFRIAVMGDLTQADIERFVGVLEGASGEGRGLDKAVILAAGRGNRIAAAASGVPKPLLSLDGAREDSTFLDWHLLALQAAGVREIYLVGNRATFGTRLRAMTDVLRPGFSTRPTISPKAGAPIRGPSQWTARTAFWTVDRE